MIVDVSRLLMIPHPCSSRQVFSWTNWRRQPPWHTTVACSTRWWLSDWKNTFATVVCFSSLSTSTCDLSMSIHLHALIRRSLPYLFYQNLSRFEKTWIKSPQSRLFSSDVIPSNFSLFSYDLYLKPFTSLVALRWTFSKQLEQSFGPRSHALPSPAHPSLAVNEFVSVI